MKYLATTIFFLTFLSQTLIAQTDTCKVLLDGISGKYKGKCKSGLANGKGESVGEDTYIGSFKDGLPHGKGKYIYKNGNVFEGNWDNGKKDGKGKLKYTLNGVKQTLSGYWKNDEYVGSSDPDITYRVTSASGIPNHQIERKEATNGHSSEITLSIKSAFSDIVPSDLRITQSSGKVIQMGNRFAFSQYFYPFHCEISYSIVTGMDRKQCHFIFDVLKDGIYSITLNND